MPCRNNPRCGFQKGHASFLTEESKKKISKSLKGKPKPWLIGRKHSDESKLKMSEAAKKDGRHPPVGHKGPHFNQMGEKNIHWKGGKKLDRGYFKIKKRGHPLADKNSYVLEHRLIVETDLGRYLEKQEIVHHINGIKTDNRIDNLRVMTRSEHIQLHHVLK